MCIAYQGGLKSERVEYYLSQSRNNIDSNTSILVSTGKYDVIAANKRILLSDNPNKGYYFSDGVKRFYQRELDYLSSKGYTFNETSNGMWEAIKK